ncbi:MAG: flippase [Candidatus Dojkabacteria bacterium]
MQLRNLILQTEDRKKIFKNVFWGLAEKILLLISGLFVYARVASYLGTEVFGQFNYVLGVYNIFLPLASLGLSNIVVAKLLEKNAKKGKILGTAAVMRLVGAIIAILGNALFLYLVDGNLVFVMLSLLMSWSYIFSSLQVIDEYFQAELQSREISIIRMIVYIVLIVFKLLAIYLGAGLKVFLFIYSLEFVLIMIGSLILYIKKYGNLKDWEVDIKVAKMLFLALLPILITLIADTFYTRYAVVVIKEVLSFSEVGIYSVAAKLGEIWYFLPVTICIALFPKITKVYNQDRVHYKKLLPTFYSILFIVPLLIILATLLFIDPFMRLIFDSSYLQSIPIFNVYVFIGIFVSLKTLNQRIYILENIQKYLIFFSILSSTISLILFYVLIPKYGAIGAPIAMIISQIFYMFILPLLFKDTREQVLYIIRGIVPWNYFKIKELFIKK